MSMHSVKTLLSVALVLLAVAEGWDTAVAAPFQPSFSPGDFVPGAPIDNPYFPLVPGTLFRYAAQVKDPDTGESSFEVIRTLVTFQTTLVGGVLARVVKDRVFLDGLLQEDTRDYFAQDKSGNVWYLGEDTTEFLRDDQGNVIGTDTTGTWHAGVHGAVPGFIMPANPHVGFSYVQEKAPQDQAEDQAEIVSLDESVSVPAGSFTKVLKTLEMTPLEPGVLENKFYAPGVGQVLIWENLDESGAPLNIIPLVSVSVTSPPAA